MSNTDTDSFIKEVSEEVRQDRMFRLWKRYGPFVIGAIVIVVGASAAWNWMKHRSVIEARERGAAFIAAGDSAGQIEILADTLEGDAATLARLRLAAALALGDERAAASEVYREVAEGAARPAYRDLALLRAIQIEALRGDPAALASELAPLTAEGRPYRPLALELRGVLRVNSGNLEAARADLETVLADETASLDTRRRVGEILNALTPGALVPSGSAAAGGASAETQPDAEAEAERASESANPSAADEAPEDADAPDGGAASRESGDAVQGSTDASETDVDQTGTEQSVEDTAGSSG